MLKEKIKGFVGINQLISIGITSNASETAVQKVVEKRVAVEVTRRVELLEKAMDKYDTAKKELLNCKPDVKNIIIVKADDDSEGTPVANESWSPKQYEVRTKLKKLIADLDIAFMHAFDDKAPDWDKLRKLVSGGNDKAKPETGE